MNQGAKKSGTKELRTKSSSNIIIMDVMNQESKDANETGNRA